MNYPFDPTGEGSVICCEGSESRRTLHCVNLLDRQLNQIVRACRYGVYAGLLSFVVLDAYLQMVPLQGALALLVILPVLVQAALHRFNAWLASILVFEVVLTIAILLLERSSVTILLAYLLVAIAGHGALWGIRSPPVLVSACALSCLLCAYLWGVNLSHEARLDVPVLVAALLVTTLFTVLAHAQTHRVLRWRSQALEQRRLLQRYLPDGILARGGGEKTVWMSVVFVDLVGFSTFAEQKPAESIRLILNDYFDAVAESVDNHGGMVSKFLGDGVLSLFVADADDGRVQCATSAIDVVREIEWRMQRLGEHWCRQGECLELKTSAGIASGYCTLADWGTGRRLDYTAIGPPVNLASRLQDIAGQLDVPLLVDQATRTLAQTSVVHSREIDVTLKGIRVRKAFVPMLT